MRYFCTYFDSNFLHRGLALYESLAERCPSFLLWILCMDEISYDTLAKLKLKRAKLIALDDFEKGDQELLRAKADRTRIEYYFTCTPSLPLYVLDNYPEVDFITYLDADLFFFSDPEVLYDEISDGSIAIIEHRFSSDSQKFSGYGKYNVSWVSFRRDRNALDCLGRWRRQCIDWCYDRLEDGRFADQKYLDDWPSSFEGVKILSCSGANVAPWNLANYDVRRKDGLVRVNGRPLVFFHFHNFNFVNRWIYDPCLSRYNVRASRAVRRRIYGPYINTLSRVRKRLLPFLPKEFYLGNIRMGGRPPDMFLKISPGRILGSCKKVLKGERILAIKNFVW